MTRPHTPDREPTDDELDRLIDQAENARENRRGWASPTDCDRAADRYFGDAR